MNLEFDETQNLLRQSAKSFLAQEWSTASAKEVMASDAGHSSQLWRKIADLGWIGLAIPEEYGGSACSLKDLAVLCEEFGKNLVPTDFYSTVSGALLLLNGGTREQKERLLPGVCSGNTRLSIAFLERGDSYDPSRLATAATQVGSKWVIEGAKLFVPDASSAQYLLVAARTAAETVDDAVTVFVVPNNSNGLTQTALVTTGGDRQSEVVFSGVTVGNDNVLGEPHRASRALAKTIEQQIALQLADALGIGQRVLDMTVDYIKVRNVFGQPIGNFQAAQHHCANMAIDLDGARFLSYHAISRLSNGESATTELSMAKAWGTQAIKRITMLAHQMHGGIGFVTEHDLLYYSNRAKSAELMLGTPAEHFEVVARQMGL